MSNTVENDKEIWKIESEEDARDLIDKLGIPKSKKDIEYILNKGKNTRDGCLITYASILCDQTPQGNAYVDELIALSMQNCDAKHINRVMYDYREISSTGITTGAEIKYNRYPTTNGICWKRSQGTINTAGQYPMNFQTKKRMLLAIYKGMIRNPNIKITQIVEFIGVLRNPFYENPFYDEVKQKFIDLQFEELKKSLLTGECSFTIEELMEESRKYIGIEKPLFDFEAARKYAAIEIEKLQKILKASTKKITSAAAAESALKKCGIATEDTTKAKGAKNEQLKRLNSKGKKGEK